MHLADPTRLQAGANADPEFRLAARYWNATLSLESPSRALRVEIADGHVASCRESEAGQPATITVVAPDDGWQQFLAPVPRPFYQDLLGNVEHDLTDLATKIDTAKTALYVLTGEYDWSSTPAMGQALAGEVRGATFRVMPGLGHFPMCENPARFREYILPVLDEIRARG